MEIVTAGMAGIPHLYHYQRHDPTRLAPIVAGQIYMSPPHEFNDPWDCRPYFNDDVTDPDVRERIIQYFYGAARKLTPHVPEDEHRRKADWFRSNVAALREAVEQMSSGIGPEISRRYRLYCLTPNPADILMWSHYSDNHRGVCLEFGADNPLFSSALQVQYCETYPEFGVADDGDTTLLPLLTKAKQWRYEAEYRLIAQEASTALNRLSLITNRNLLTLPPLALKAVIIGCLMPSNEREEVMRIVMAAPGGIALKQALRMANRYALIIEPFA